MELLFDILAEIIFEPILEGYFLAMSHFSVGSKKINEYKIKTVVVFEGIVLLVMFVVGGCMLLETDGESLMGKILLIASVAVSSVQISLGIIFKNLKKKGTFTRKITNEEQLKDLIIRMCNEDDCSEESISWQAYREAENISERSFLPFLQNIVIENQKNITRDKTVRKAVYHIIANIVKNSFDEQACRFLIDRLDVEKDKYILSGILGYLTWVDIPWNIHIEPIIRLSKSEKWLIRHSAVQALGSSATVKSKEAIYFYINQDDEKKYKYEIIYANMALGKIGKSEDIAILEKHLRSRIPDIRDSAVCAIESIKKRNC